MPPVIAVKRVVPEAGVRSEGDLQWRGDKVERVSARLLAAQGTTGRLTVSRQYRFRSSATHGKTLPRRRLK
jgi:hypothetical protein